MHLQLSKREFYELTPRLFSALWESWRDEQRSARRAQRALFALLRADVINFSMARPKRRVEALELLPKEDRALLSGSDAGRPRRRLTGKRRQEIADSFRRMFAPHLERN